MYRMELKICPICGRKFYPAVMHKYKKKWRRKTYTTCSYSCFSELLRIIKNASSVNKLLDKDTSDVL